LCKKKVSRVAPLSQPRRNESKNSIRKSAEKKECSMFFESADKEKSMKVALYTRVSTQDQSVEMQLADLNRYSKERGFDVYKEYNDEGISGTKDRRPALDELMEDARKKKFNAVLCWRFDRFARSTKHLITALEEFRHLGIEFISYQENIDTSSPLGKAIFTIVSAIAELERNIIIERVKAGIMRAKQNGKRLGRPKRLNLNVEELQKMRDRGFSLKKIGEQVRACPATIFKILKEARDL
jgi:DNA invertase Pin-like site-specific DNA recombinase